MKQKNGRKTFCVTLPPEKHELIKQIAIDKNKHMSYLIEELMDDLIESWYNNPK